MFKDFIGIDIPGCQITVAGFDSRFEDVLSAERNGIHAEFIRQHVHHAFHGEVHLYISEAPEGADQTVIGVGDLPCDVHMGKDVKPAGMFQRQTQDGGP